MTAGASWRGCAQESVDGVMMARRWITPDPDTATRRSLVVFLGMPSLVALAIAPVCILAAIDGEFLLAAYFGCIYPFFVVLQIPAYLRWRSWARGGVWIENDRLFISSRGGPPKSFRRDEILSIRLQGYFGWRALYSFGSPEDFPSLSIHGEEQGAFLLWRGESEAARLCLSAWWKKTDE